MAKKKKMSHLEYANKHRDKIVEKLGEYDVVLSNQKYAGSGITRFFGVPEDVPLVRLGRRDFEDHQRIRFTRRKMGDIVGLDAVDYSLLLPITRENVDRLLKTGDAQFFMLTNYQEGEDGYFNALDPDHIESKERSVQDIARSMPKIRVPKVTRTDVNINGWVTKGVLSSNADDEGNIEIASVTGKSSLLYNPHRKVRVKPAIYWGSFGWKEPIKVLVGRDEVFFDERQNGGKMYRIEFQSEGYNPTELA